MVNLEVVDVDEMKLNTVIHIGTDCPNLKKLCLQGCHFQMQPGDWTMVDALCNANSHQHQNSNLFSKRERKRLRLIDGGGVLLFDNLRSFDIYLKSPAHMPVFQLILSHAPNLEKLIFDQFYSDYDESLSLAHCSNGIIFRR